MNDYDFTELREEREKRKRAREEYERQQQQPRADWLRLCVMSDSRSPKPLPIVENVYIALANDPALKAKFAFDEMLQEATTGNSVPRSISDDDIVDLQRYLQRSGLKRIGKDAVTDGLYNYARDHCYHPLRDYLDSLEWDGMKRLPNWTQRYLGVSHASNYASLVGEKFLISMVARIYRPGCKADYMLILEGPQGIKKSMACKILAGEYFSDSLPDLKDASKDVYIHLAGKWLLEIGELHQFNRADTSHLKLFLTKDTDRYRPVYAKVEVHQPRQCVFIGTSNKDQYLRDETGGRRFWPLKCGDIDIEALGTDRDQLFAEAVVAFKAGKSWWPDDEQAQVLIEPEQEARYEADEWDVLIRDYLDNRLITPTVTVAQIAKEAVGLEPNRLGMIEQKRIAAGLVRCNWMRRVVHGKRFWEPKR